MINQDKKCIQLCGLNVTNIFTVGLLSGLIGAGVAYFILIRSSDFQWWWLIALFGVQFLSVIAVAYAFQKTLSLNNMFCETPVLVSNCDWSSLRAARVTTPRLIQSDCAASTNESTDINSADWQDLLRQLDQLSHVTTLTPVLAVISDATSCAPTVATIPTPPASPPAAPTFDFSTMASALAPPAPAPITTPVSTPAPITSTPTKTTTPATPVTQPAQPQIQPSQGIDFASLFR